MTTAFAPAVVAGSSTAPAPSAPTADAAPAPTSASARLAPHASASAFDVVHDRTGTASLKWDFAARRGRPDTALPLWVADMDHTTAPAVTNALLWR
ncbi:pyridoxal phosphate-dependent aminotransferase, partial [Actinomyces sp. MRS3W]|nr:pyridoxal phosphate-dependent aminotransferase [Actinomyces sp. MRS3W]